MEKATIFENLKCWRASTKLLMTVNAVSKAGRISEKFFLKTRMKRKGVVAMSAIAEGFNKSGSAEFISFLNASQRSLAELKCMVHLLAAQDLLVTNTTHEIVHHMTDEMRHHTVDLITYLQSNK